MSGWYAGALIIDLAGYEVHQRISSNISNQQCLVGEGGWVMVVVVGSTVPFMGSICHHLLVMMCDFGLASHRFECLGRL